MSNRRRMWTGIAWLVLVNVIWSATFPTTAIALGGMSSIFLALIRLGAGALVLSPFLRLGEGYRWSWRVVLFCLVMGIIGFSLPFYLENQGLAWSTPAMAAIAIALEPLFTVLVAAFMLKEKLSRLRQVAILIALIGAWAIAGFPRPGRAGYLAGDLLLILGILCYGIYNAYSTRLTLSLPPTAATALTLWFGFLGSIPMWLIAGAPIPHHLTAAEWTSTAYLALVATAGAFLIWTFVLQHVEVGMAALFLYLQPVLGVILSVLIVGTRPGVTFYIGSTLILLAIYLGRNRDSKTN